MIGSTKSVIIRAMLSVTFFLRMLTVAGMLVWPYFAAFAQPPLIFPQPKRNSFQVPVIEPRRDAAPEDSGAGNQHPDAWFLIEYDGATIGYETLSTSDIDVATDESGVFNSRRSMPGVHRSRETHLKLKRFGNDLSVSAHLETIETVDGTLQSWSLRRTAADGSAIQRSAAWDTARHAFMIRDGTTVESKSELLQSRVQPQSPILSAWLGVPNPERPQQWVSAVMFPETSVIVDVEIRRMPPQSLRLRDGATIDVTRYEYWPANQRELRSSVYYDAEQAVVLAEQPLFGRMLRFWHTDAATALGEENLQSLDLQLLSGLPLRRPLLNLENSNVVRMMISVGDSEQISLPSSDFQHVEQPGTNTLIVELTRPVPETEGSAQQAPVRRHKRPDRKYTDHSTLLDSNDENVRRMAVIGGGAVSDPHEKCRRLTTYVGSHMRLTSFSTLLLPASDVAKSRQGDCTEYAVLLAAVMRSEGVPSRVAVGFAYVPSPPSLAPHMWTEAWIDGQWIPFDATLGVEVNPLTRLKVNDSALSDSVTSGTLLFVPLLSFLGRATVEILPEE